MSGLNTFSVGARRPPIIFVGMHRSGTSMLTGFLSELGLNTGWSLDHDEAVFFQKLNIYVERVCNCGWDNPLPIKWLEECTDLRAKVLTHLRNNVQSWRALLFFGWPAVLRNHSIVQYDKPWGWKDPRNTFTFDLWKEVFPDAKVIHIYRNGVDIAASLRERELKDPPLPESVYSSARCCTLQRGYELWEEYIEKAFSIIPDGGSEKMLSLSYESFLSDPMQMLNRLCTFCEVTPSKSVLERTARQADPSRAYGFIKTQELVEFYISVKDRPWMKKLGYSGVL